MKNDDEKLVLLFFEVMKLTKRFALNNSENNVNLMIGQYRCLQLLYLHKFMTQKELAEKLNIRSTSLSETITKLAEKGLINRDKCERDKRTFVVSMTEAGRICAEEDYKRREEVYSSILEPLSDDDKEQFTNILGKIKKNYLEQEKITIE